MKISVIFPCKNQFDKLIPLLKEKVIPYYDSIKGLTYDVWLINDHSSQEQFDLIQREMPSLPGHVHLCSNESLPGKGFAVKCGVEHADGDYCMFMDADLSTDLSAFDSIYPQIQSFDAFFASRNSEGSVVNPKQKGLRRLAHSVSRRLIRHKFHFKGIDDTQCGYKVFRTDVAKEMAKRQIVNGFAFDVEYAYFLQLNGFRIKNVPVIWRNDADSSVKSLSKATKVFLKDLRRIKKNKKAYLLSEEEKAGLNAKKGSAHAD